VPQRGELQRGEGRRAVGANPGGVEPEAVFADPACDAALRAAVPRTHGGGVGQCGADDLLAGSRRHHHRGAAIPRAGEVGGSGATRTPGDLSRGRQRIWLACERRPQIMVRRAVAALVTFGIPVTDFPSASSARPPRARPSPQPPADGGRPRTTVVAGPPEQAIDRCPGERPARPEVAQVGVEATAPGIRLVAGNRSGAAAPLHRLR
jgi:hypothetical protein